MIAVLLSFVLITFVLYTVGDITIILYRKACKKDEQFNILDTILIGMVMLTAVLSISSIWLPTNHYLLSFFLLMGIIYRIINSSRFYLLILKIKKFFSPFSKLSLFLLFSSFIILIIYMLWASHWFDATYYHYQNIRWNEEYPAVPGLANLEHRFGFNSSYFLLAALFSLRCIFGEAIYGLQFTAMILLLAWIFIEIVRSNFELKRIFLLVFYFLFFVLNIEAITDSSTDFIPNLCIFYLVARLALYPKGLEDNKLLYFILPLSLVSFKLSVAPFCLILIFILFDLFKKKDFKTIIFFILISVVIIIPWIVRTTIVTGYLFFPFSQVDLFDFDWKIPSDIVAAEVSNVRTFAHYLFDLYFKFKYIDEFGLEGNKFILLTVVIIMINGIWILFSVLLVGYKYLKNRKSIFSGYWKMYATLIITLIYWYIMAPDPRFAYGTILGLSFLSLSILLSRKEYYFPRIGKMTMIAFTFIMLLSSFKRVYNCYMLLYPTSLKEGRKPFSSILIQPYSSMNQAEAKGINYKPLTTYKMGDLDIYISADLSLGATYDLLPATSLYSLKYQVKYQPLETVEARGKSLKEGFRPKEEYRNKTTNFVIGKDK